MIDTATLATRRRLVLDAGGNGIDFVEVDRYRALLVRFLAPLPAGAYDLPNQPRRIAIEGGVDVTRLRPVRVTHVRPAALLVELDRPGDLSTYTLAIDAPLDPALRRAAFTFRRREPIDCQPAPSLPQEPPVPLADYLARDYASFLQVLLDLSSQLDPSWTERSAADLGIALVELLAYTGDHLAYLQDAIANEGFLDRVRLRISARRHARLLDVRMRDGRNAWTWACFTVQTAGTVPARTRISTAAPSPGPLTPDALEQEPALAGSVVFETEHDQAVDPLLNCLRLHDWGVAGAHLPAGATGAYLYALDGGGQAVRPSLRAGDWLLLEEVAGESGGLDPTHRQVVHLTAVRDSDPAGGDLVDPLANLPLVLVEWDAADAVRTPFLLSPPADTDETWPPAAIFTVARGNVAVADHGLTTGGTLVGPAAALPTGPLTVACPPPDPGCDVDAAGPAIELRVNGDVWTPVPDLIGSGPFDQAFVVEIDDDGIGRLRFGDGVHGARLPDGAALNATWRVGSGSAGNVGADSLLFLEVDDPTQPWVQGASVRNPLEARDGRDPESIADLRGRLSLPASPPRRAVTEADYVDAVAAVPGVAAAAATVRWTGSWYTAFVAVQPADARDVVVDETGGRRLAPGLAALVEARLAQVRLAGRDVEVRPPHPVGLDVVLGVGRRAGPHAPDVLDAVRQAVLARPPVLGGPVFPSDLLAVAQAVEGVASVTITRFRPFGQPDRGELEAGVVDLGPFDLASLDNDPDRPQLGVLRVTAAEGRA